MQPQTLEELFEHAKARAQAQPRDITARSALWQIFSARGENERARKQLDVLLELDSSWALEVQACRGLLKAEEARAAVFSGEAAPECIGEPPPWFGDLSSGLRLLASDPTAAAALLAQAQSQARPCPGQLNGTPFDWLCDGDARLGPCLELIVHERYFWVPWESVRSLVTRPPNEVRDRLWQPALLEITEEGPVEVFLPVRYPAPQDDAQALSRRTDWEPIAGDLYIGRGQKCLLTSTGETGYLDLRQLTFDTPAADGESR